MIPSSRLATPQDEHFLFELFCSTREDLMLLPEQVRGQILEMQFKAKRAQYAGAYPVALQAILMVEDEQVGAMLVDYGDEIRLVDIAIMPRFRNHGYGSAVLQELCGMEKPITLHVSMNNPARRLYERLGFVEIGRDEVYAEMRREP